LTVPHVAVGRLNKLTELCFDKNSNCPDDLWTTERLKEEFFLSIASTKEIVTIGTGIPVTGEKYYRQAKEKMYLIPIAKPSIPFIIKFSDLSLRVRQEFHDYCGENDEKHIGLFLKEIAGRFFENLDFEYYHGSVMRNLRVRLEP
jgi:hypothetical protein